MVKCLLKRGMYCSQKLLHTEPWHSSIDMWMMFHTISWNSKQWHDMIFFNSLKVQLFYENITVLLLCLLFCIIALDTPWLQGMIFGICKEWASSKDIYLTNNKYFFCCIFFWRARVCRPLLCLCRPFMIFEGCLDSNPEYCRSKLARYRLSHPSLS